MSNLINDGYTVLDSKTHNGDKVFTEQLIRSKSGKYYIIDLDENGELYSQTLIEGTPITDLHGNKILTETLKNAEEHGQESLVQNKEEENMNTIKTTPIDIIITLVSEKEKVDCECVINALVRILTIDDSYRGRCKRGVYLKIDKNNKNIIHLYSGFKQVNSFYVSEEDKEKFLMEIKNSKMSDVVQPKVEKAHSDNLFETFTKKSRLHKLVNKIEKSKTPEEAYDLLVEFLDDDYEQDGSVKYKGVRIKYFVAYDKSSNGEVKLDVKIIDLKDQNPQPVLATTVRFNRESISRVYNGIKKLVELSQ